MRTILFEHRISTVLHIPKNTANKFEIFFSFIRISISTNTKSSTLTIRLEYYASSLLSISLLKIHRSNCTGKAIVIENLTPPMCILPYSAGTKQKIICVSEIVLMLQLLLMLHPRGALYNVTTVVTSCYK